MPSDTIEFAFADGEDDVRQRTGHKLFMDGMSRDGFPDYYLDDEGPYNTTKPDPDFGEDFFEFNFDDMVAFDPSKERSKEELLDRAKDYSEQVSELYCSSIPDGSLNPPDSKSGTYSTPIDTEIIIPHDEIALYNDCTDRPILRLVSVEHGSVVVDPQYFPGFFHESGSRKRNATIISGAYIFTPDLGFTGVATIRYQVTNAFLKEGGYGTVTIQVG